MNLSFLCKIIFPAASCVEFYTFVTHSAPVMLRKLFACQVLALLYFPLFSQSIDAYPDTVVCSGEPVTLYTTVDGSYSADTYNMIDIPFAPETYAGTNVFPSGIDDAHTTPIDLGFEFCYFGNTYTQIYISTNGWVSFSPPPGPAYVTGGGSWDINYGPGPTLGADIIPDAAANVPKNAIFCPWQDWYPPLCGATCVKYQTIGTAPYQKFVVSWINVPMFLCNSLFGTFQIVLDETTNTIEDHIEDKDSGCFGWLDDLATEGLQNSSGTIAYTAPGRNAQSWSASNESIQWKPSAIDWYIGGTLVGSGDSLVVNPATTTTYTATITLCDGTMLSDDVTVTIASPYTVTNNVQNISCNGAGNGWIAVDVTGNSYPVTYTWNSGQTTDSIYDLGPGTYIVTIVEDSGCTTVDTVMLADPPVLTLDTLSTQNLICFDGADGLVNLTASGGIPPYLFSDDGSSYGTDSVFSGLDAGLYTFYVKDSYGCVETFSLTLTEPPPTTVDAGINITIPYGGSSPIDATTPVTDISTIVWTPPDGLSCTDCLDPVASPFSNTVYTIVLTDDNGCVATDSMEVYVDEDFIVPTAFTPNGDGVNDIFEVHSELIRSFDMTIYNRWGQELFHSEDADIGWDGTVKGIPQEMGSYVYKITAVTLLGTVVKKAGTVLLLR